MKLNLMLLVLIFFSYGCSSISRYPKQQPNYLNSVSLKLPRDKAYNLTIKVLRELDLKVSEIDVDNSNYVLAHNETPAWNYLLTYYGNYGSDIAVYFRDSAEGTTVWVESEKKFKFIGALFEKDWSVEVLNQISINQIDYRDLDKKRNIALTPEYQSREMVNSKSNIAKENVCLKDNEWARSSNREQGGGWLWFSGKSSSKSLKLAYKEAEGMALYRLSQECSGVHMNTRIIERCDDQASDGSYVAYVRASLENSDCQSYSRSSESERSKMANPLLNKLVAEYQKN